MQSLSRRFFLQIHDKMIQKKKKKRYLLLFGTAGNDVRKKTVEIDVTRSIIGVARAKSVVLKSYDTTTVFDTRPTNESAAGVFLSTFFFLY